MKKCSPRGGGSSPPSSATTATTTTTTTTPSLLRVDSPSQEGDDDDEGRRDDDEALLCPGGAFRPFGTDGPYCALRVSDDYALVGAHEGWVRVLSLPGCTTVFEAAFVDSVMCLCALPRAEDDVSGHAGYGGHGGGRGGDHVTMSAVEAGGGVGRAATSTSAAVTWALNERIALGTADGTVVCWHLRLRSTGEWSFERESRIQLRGPTEPAIVWSLALLDQHLLVIGSRGASPCLHACDVRSRLGNTCWASPIVLLRPTDDHRLQGCGDDTVAALVDTTPYALAVRGRRLFVAGVSGHVGVVCKPSPQQRTPHQPVAGDPWHLVVTEVWRQHASPIRCLEVTDAGYIATGDESGRICVWKEAPVLEAGEEEVGEEDVEASAAASPVTGRVQGSAPRGVTCVATLQCGKGYCMALASRHNLLASGCAVHSYDVTLWSLVTMQRLATSSLHTTSVRALLFHEALLASFSYDGTARTWLGATRAREWVRNGHRLVALVWCWRQAQHAGMLLGRIPMDILRTIVATYVRAPPWPLEPVRRSLRAYQGSV